MTKRNNNKKGLFCVSMQKMQKSTNYKELLGTHFFVSEFKNNF